MVSSNFIPFFTPAVIFCSVFFFSAPTKTPSWSHWKAAQLGTLVKILSTGNGNTGARRVVQIFELFLSYTKLMHLTIL